MTEANRRRILQRAHSAATAAQRTWATCSPGPTRPRTTTVKGNQRRTMTSIANTLSNSAWRIDMATQGGRTPTETPTATEKGWVAWYRRSYEILLARKGISFDKRKSFLSLTNRSQRAYGLVLDGVPGPKTADMLRRLAGYRVQA
jgi:hypothetical protein